MAIFTFSAKDNLGAPKFGTVEANDRDSALQLLKNQNLVVISIQEKQASFADKLFKFGGVSEDEVTTFTREFSVMISSGLPINKALNICVNQFEGKNFKEVLLEISKDIDSGTSLSGAFARFPDVFDTSYISLVRAGESSGKLEVVLKRLAESYEAIRDLKSRLKAALIYPAIVLVVMFLVILVLVVYVIPKLTEIFVSINQPLPWHTQFLVNVSSFVTSFWYLLFAIVLALFFGIRYYLSTIEGQMMLSTLIYKIPVIGKVVKQTELANYMRTLALLVSAGVQITEALIIVSKVSNNPQLSKASLEASKFVEKGNALSDYLRSNTFFDPIISSMAKIGEETGQMDELLYKVADNYSNESSYAIKGLSASLEPIILVILGISVGSIVLSVITPIYGLIGNLSQ